MTTSLDAVTARAVRAVARASRVLERALDDLSLAHYRVLTAVADGDERASRIASRLALGKPTISASVDALCRRGLLERSTADDDQRATALRLTAAGETALADAEKALAGRVRELLDRTAEPDAVLAALVALGDAVDGFVTDRVAQREEPQRAEPQREGQSA